MNKDFTIKIREYNKPYQTFNGNEYFLHARQKYFKRNTHFMHRDVWKHYNGAIPKGYHIHHRDNDTWNNRIENLELIEGSKHNSSHIKKRIENNPEWIKQFQQKGIEAAKNWHKSEEGRKWHSEHGKEIYEKRQPKIKICEFCKKEYSTKHNGVSKFCHQNCKAKARRRRII